MKKRITGLLLILCLCLTLLPGTAFAAAYEQEEVSEVSVSVAAPTAGSDLTASTPTAEGSQPYYIAYSSWTRVVAKGCTADADDWTTWSDSFQADNWYQLSVKLLLDYGYVYANNVTAQVPGAEMVEVERSGDDTVYVNAWFKVGDPAEVTTQIGSISISNLPTERMDKVADWTDAIKAAAVSDANAYRISSADLYAWDSAESKWSYIYSSESTDSSKVYGVRLIINSLQGHVFTDSTTATVNNKTAEITERKADEIEVFVPFGTVTINSVEVDSDTWPIDGNTIHKDPDNFSIGAADIGYTLESAQFQIKDGNGVYRDLVDEETKFSGDSDYRVIAVLKAKGYATFASSVTGDFNGTGGVRCEISDGGKTCTVTRTCKVYDPIYTYPTSDPNQHINGVTIYRNDPVAGQTYVDDKFSPDGQSIYLRGADGSYRWYEVPYVGSTTQIKKLENSDTFEDGKVYLSTLTLSNLDGYRFGEGFTVSFKQLDGSDSNNARMECTRDTAKSKWYNIWYTVGEVTQQAVTEVAITGPEPENGTIDTSDLSKFNTATAGVTVTSARYSAGNDYNYLYLTLTSQSGYYFGRTVAVTYNGKTAIAYAPAFSDRFGVQYVIVDYTATPATPITVSGITAKDKIYDGTTAAELDISAAVLSGVETGDRVTLDISGAKAEFESKDVGADKKVTITGTLRLTGEDAYKYTLTQPDLSALTADITACTDFTDATNQNQTIYVGEDSFESPRFTGIGGEAVTGTLAYQLTDGKTDADIPWMLCTLKAGEQLLIPYTFTASGNYAGTKTGTITVTAQNRPTSGSGVSTYAITADSAGNGTVTVSPKSASKGTTVTITVTPGTGYTLETLTVTDRSGNELKLTDKGNGEFTFTMPASKVEIKATFMEDNTMLNFFVDVPADAYYYDAVLWATKNGITGGVDETHFAPNAPCTRAQIVTFLWRAAGSPVVNYAMNFSDVPDDAYYAEAVRWAVSQGITTGTGDGKFSPDATCTRAQAMTFLWRSQKSVALDGVNSFTDVAADAYYADAVLWAVKEDITNGTSPTTFSPDVDCTRAQIVTFLWRALAE